MTIGDLKDLIMYGDDDMMVFFPFGEAIQGVPAPLVSPCLMDSGVVDVEFVEPTEEDKKEMVLLNKTTFTQKVLMLSPCMGHHVDKKNNLLN